MAERVTFLHTADLHLGAPFKGLRSLSPKWAERLQQAIPEAFDKLIEVAIQRQVDFVVAAGDIFDQAQPSYANYLKLREGFMRLQQAGIPVYACTGNHDPYVVWRTDYVDLPDNVFLFPADQSGFFLFEKQGRPLVLLGGRGFFNKVFDPTQDVIEGITREYAAQALGTQAPFAVGVVHTGLNLDPEKAPSSVAKMLRTGMDYWALGHIHTPWRDSEDNPRVVFPGCIQGRAINETGARGCNIVHLEEGKPNRLEFVPLASVVWQMLEVDVEQCETLMAIQSKIESELFALNGQAQCPEMVERITLCGATPLHATLRTPGVLEDLRAGINNAHPSFFCDSIIDETRSPIDKEALRAEGLFPAVLLGISDANRMQAEAAVQYLDAEFTKKGIALPPEYQYNVAQLQLQAEDLALDLLGRAED